MSYVKVTNGTVDQYPYTIGQLRRDNPNTSFPKSISEEVLNSYGVYKVVNSETPTFDIATQYLETVDPVLVGDTWKTSQTVVTRTAEQQVEFDERTARVNRRERDNRIVETDWWASSDLTMTAEQTAYRQALRDITTHANWPHLGEDDWPTKP